MLNPHICSYCANACREACVTECAPTGNYCAFAPRPLRDWEGAPTFPLAAFLEMTAREARVLMGLYLFWQSPHHAADGRLPSLNGHRRPSANNHHRRRPEPVEGRCLQWPTNG
jgi:hypothetical protein